MSKGVANVANPCFACNSETENDLRERIVMNYVPYLGAVRARHNEPSARSPSFALLEQPGLEAFLSVREENSEMGCGVRKFASNGMRQGATKHRTGVLDLKGPSVDGGSRAGGFAPSPTHLSGLELADRGDLFWYLKFDPPARPSDLLCPVQAQTRPGSMAGQRSPQPFEPARGFGPLSATETCFIQG